MPLILDKDNLYQAYWKARRGKEAKHEVLRYSEHLEANLSELQNQIREGCAEVGKYRYFTIFDPKERTICAAPFPQRVLHHALMNVCGPLLDKRQILDSFASQKGKGTYAALERAQQLHRKYQWCLKMDVRKYFDNIHHQVLKQQLASFFKETQLLKLFFDIIDSYNSGHEERGLPIGNLTSQFFANHYLSVVDHWVYEEAKVDGWVRYMDDILVYGNDRNELLEKGRKIREKIKNSLQLDLKVFDLRPTKLTTQFLGYRLTSEKMILSRRSQTRFRKKLTQYQYYYKNGIWNDETYRNHLAPLLGFAVKAQTFHYRKAVMKTIEKRDAS